MADLVSQVIELRGQGLTDNLIVDELTKRGNPAPQVNEAIAHADANTPSMPVSSGMPPPSFSPPASGGDMYGRMEEMTESLIDEKWDELVKEVRKIIDWKEKVEATQTQLTNDIAKLKEDFKTLHQGVLGKLDTYDNTIQEVGTELKAVGKVFKDVIPEFVEGVKEFSAMRKK